MDKPKFLSITLIALIASLVIAWGALSIGWRTSKSLELPIAAFQARNWLYGEHLLFRIQLDATESCQPQDHYACAKPVEFSSRSFKGSCPLELKGECREGQFVTKVHRFYLSDQSKLSTTFPHYYQKGQMTLRVSRRGPMFVEDFSFPARAARK